MKTLILVISLFLISSCESNETYDTNPSHEEIKITLEEQENATPTDFLTATGTYRQNLINQWVIEGTVSNNATLATYKDIVVKIVYYSKTKTEIGSEEKTLFEYFKPNTNQKFKIKSEGFEGTSSIGFDVISANSVQ